MNGRPTPGRKTGLTRIGRVTPNAVIIKQKRREQQQLLLYSFQRRNRRVSVFRLWFKYREALRVQLVLPIYKANKCIRVGIHTEYCESHILGDNTSGTGTRNSRYPRIFKHIHSSSSMHALQQIESYLEQRARGPNLSEMKRKTQLAT